MFKLAIVAAFPMILFGNMDTPTVNQNTIKDLKVTDTTPQFPDRRAVVEQQKIEAEKAAEAARQAEAQRQAQVATQTAQASYRPAPVAVTGSCGEWMAAAGVTDPANAYTLIMRESGCNPNALNRSSGACGIPQAPLFETWNLRPCSTNKMDAELRQQ